MNWSEVLARIQNGEDERTEFKRSFDDRGRVGRAVAAFANTDGGLIVLGVDDSETIRGTRDDPDTLAERLTNFLQSGLSAPVQARLGRHRAPEGWVHWVEVPRQRGFEPIRSGGQVYVRRGRVDVTSPGTLPNTITPASVKAGGHPRSRNELLANYMVTMGMMEQRGRGWPIIRRAMLNHSGLEPELDEDRESRFVRVTLPIDASGQGEAVDQPIRDA